MNDTIFYIIFITIIAVLVVINVLIRYYVRYYLRRRTDTLTFKFNTIDNNYFTNEEVCSICLSQLNDIENNIPVYQTKCNHFYHKECIDSWIHSHNLQSFKCPLCLEQMY